MGDGGNTCNLFREIIEILSNVFQNFPDQCFVALVPFFFITVENRDAGDG